MTMRTTKFIVGEYKKEVCLRTEGSRIWVTFGYNKILIEEIKAMEGAKWHGFEDPPVKQWSIKNCARNRFQIAFLEGKNPYEMYDRPVIQHITKRPLYDHQRDMVNEGLTRRWIVLAAEMGTGKSLAAIEIMEHIQDTIGLKDIEAWYVGPKAGVFAFGRELVKWTSKVHPKMMTYEGLVKEMKNINSLFVPPRIVILDESSKVKTPTSQRSQAAQQLSELMREHHGDDCYIIEMSGTPAPKTPVDWWMQAEIACPGFIREGNIHKFKARMCIIEERQSITGGVYPHVVTWLDDSKKCKICGQFKEANVHDEWYMSNEEMELKKFIEEANKAKAASDAAGLTDPAPVGTEYIKGTAEVAISKKFHNFMPSTDEVSYLYQRMKGLVLVKFKKDCLDLPEKQYRIIEITPPPDLIRSMKIIKKKTTRAIEALTLLRELSDGFQYTERKTGEQECPICHGTKTIVAPVPRDGAGVADIFAPTSTISREDYVSGVVTCDNCGGTGRIPTYERAVDAVASPKDSVFIDLLDEHEDVGRFIVWGGFTGTIDRLVDMCKKYGWAVLRVDGRGFHGMDADGATLPSDELLDAMDLSNPKFKEYLEKYPRICFVGHPQAGGMALTLTASPTELFYSNCFNGEARMQAEDRFHRAGMDKNRGATIIDLMLLPTDKLVLDNLKKKKKLQDLSMGELEKAIEAGEGDEKRF